MFRAPLKLWKDGIYPIGQYRVLTTVSDMVSHRYQDYFVFLYQYIESKLQMELPSRWEDARIEFIFSVPTTWKPHPTVERFRSITARAGFGRYPNHKSTIGLTEAEAAAVHMSRESPAIFRVRIDGLYRSSEARNLTIMATGERYLDYMRCWWGNNCMALSLKNLYINN